MAKEEKNALRPASVKQANLTPTSDAATNDELLNAQSGTLPSVGAMPVGREDTARSVDDPVSFRRGMFALMASFDWDKGKFSEHPQDVALRNEAMGLLNLPAHLSSQFSQERMNEFMQTLQMVGKHKGHHEETSVEDKEEVRRQTDYVRNLIKLSQARHSDKKPK